MMTYMPLLENYEYLAKLHLKKKMHFSSIYFSEGSVLDHEYMCINS